MSDKIELYRLLERIEHALRRAEALQERRDQLLFGVLRELLEALQRLPPRTYPHPTGMSISVTR